MAGTRNELVPQFLIGIEAQQGCPANAGVYWLRHAADTETLEDNPNLSGQGKEKRREITNREVESMWETEE